MAEPYASRPEVWTFAPGAETLWKECLGWRRFSTKGTIRMLQSEFWSRFHSTSSIVGSSGGFVEDTNQSKRELSTEGKRENQAARRVTTLVQLRECDASLGPLEDAHARKESD